MTATARRVLFKAVAPLASNYTGVAWGHYFLSGKLVSREQYLASRPNRQGKAGKGERAQVPGSRGAGTAKPAAPAAAKPSPAPSLSPAAGDLRHNPLLDDLFDRPTEPAKPVGGDIRAAGPDIFGEPPRHPSKHNPAITYGHADDRDSDDAHFDRQTRAANREVAAAKRELAQAQARGPNETPEVRQLRQKLERHTRRAAKLRDTAAEHDRAARRAASDRIAIASHRARNAPAPGANARPSAPIPLEHATGGAFAPQRAPQERSKPPGKPSGKPASQPQAQPQAQPPPLPHQRTQQAALEAATALSEASRGGDRKATAAAHQRAIGALQAHLSAGLRAIDRMAAERYGSGPRGQRAAAKAKEAFRLKVRTVGRRLAGLRTGVKGKALSNPSAFFPPAPEDVWNLTTGAFDMQPDLVPWRVKKVGGDDLLAYLVPEADFKCDGAKLVVHGTATTDTMDPQRDIVLPPGIDLGRHKQNPIVLLNHRKDLPGIARTKSPDGEYTVRLVDEHRMDTANYFDQGSKLSVQSFRLIESGALGGLSIGFFARPGGVHKVKAPDGEPAYVYSNVELMEITHAPIGWNKDAVVHAVEKGFGGESLCPELKEVLTPYLPERKPLANGWSPPMTDVIDKAVGVIDKAAAMGTTDDSAGGTTLGDDSGGDLTASTEFFHTAHAAVENLIGYVTDQLKTIESPSTRESADELLGLLGKCLDGCQEGHATHLTDHPDQPPLPDPLDSDRNADDDETMKMYGEKAVRAWAAKVKAMAKELAVEEVKKAHAHAEVLDEFARDAGKYDRRSRTLFKAMARDFRGFKGGVTPVVTESAADREDREWREAMAVVDERIAASKAGAGVGAAA